MTTDVTCLLASLPNQFHKKLLCAVVQNLDDTTNELRATNFSTGFRELTRHVLAELAPPEQIKACSWFKPEASASDGITRRHRAQYLIHGGLPALYAEDVLGIDVESSLKSLLKAINELSKFVHVNEATFAVPATEVERLAQASFAALEALMLTASHCHMELCSQISTQVHADVVQKILAETVQEIDIVATHHTIEWVSVDDIEVKGVTANMIFFAVYGNVEVELQWGSGSDVRSGEGSTANESFPLTCQFTSTVAAPEDVTFVDGSLCVDNSSWFGVE